MIVSFSNKCEICNVLWICENEKKLLHLPEMLKHVCRKSGLCQSFLPKLKKSVSSLFSRNVISLSSLWLKFRKAIIHKWMKGTIGPCWLSLRYSVKKIGKIGNELNQVLNITIECFASSIICYRKYALE